MLCTPSARQQLRASSSVQWCPSRCRSHCPICNPSRSKRGLTCAEHQPNCLAELLTRQLLQILRPRLAFHEFKSPKGVADSTTDTVPLISKLVRLPWDHHEARASALLGPRQHRFITGIGPAGIKALLHVVVPSFLETSHLAEFTQEFLYVTRP
jgi:hypothetical protein